MAKMPAYHAYNLGQSCQKLGLLLQKEINFCDSFYAWKQINEATILSVNDLRIALSEMPNPFEKTLEK